MTLEVIYGHIRPLFLIHFIQNIICSKSNLFKALYVDIFYVGYDLST